MVVSFYDYVGLKYQKIADRHIELLRELKPKEFFTELVIDELLKDFTEREVHDFIVLHNRFLDEFRSSRSRTHISLLQKRWMNARDEYESMVLDRQNFK